MRGVLCTLATLLLTRLCAPAIRSPKLSLVDWNSYNYHEPSGPGTYAFGYDIDDPSSNNVQFRDEERHPNGTVTGSYGYVQPDGSVRLVRYIADRNGYRQTEENPYKLSMLKPIRYPDTPFFAPPAPTPYYQYEPYRHFIPTRPTPFGYNQGYPIYRRSIPQK